MSADTHFNDIAGIVTDIEGTTSSISFVKDVLFPYATEHMEQYLHDHYDKPEVASQLNTISQECNIHRTDLNALCDQLLDWIRHDVKATPLKNLQGLIWETGYRSGDYQAHMYEDATRQLKAWHQRSIPLYVYSSGSEYAQKLFFGYSQAGNLLPLFKGHFDTNIGHKQQSESYKAIQLLLDIPAEQLLFLSDVEAELDAAQSAGWQTCHVIRDQHQIIEACRHPAVRSFDEININVG